MIVSVSVTAWISVVITTLHVNTLMITHIYVILIPPHTLGHWTLT